VAGGKFNGSQTSKYQAAESPLFSDGDSQVTETPAGKDAVGEEGQVTAKEVPSSTVGFGSPSAWVSCEPLQFL